MEQDPNKPTYFGTSLTKWYQYCHYFEGMMYGLSWGVVKTIAAAGIPKDVVTNSFDEDARTGELMVGVMRRGLRLPEEGRVRRRTSALWQEADCTNGAVTESNEREEGSPSRAQATY